MTGNRFYVELHGDEHGNTALPTAVIEGRMVQGGTPEACSRYLSNPARPALLIDGPAEIAGRWTGVYADAYGGFAEVEGPARMLSRAEYDELIASLGVPG